MQSGMPLHESLAVWMWGIRLFQPSPPPSAPFSPLSFQMISDLSWGRKKLSAQSNLSQSAFSYGCANHERQGKKRVLLVWRLPHCTRSLFFASLYEQASSRASWKTFPVNYLYLGVNRSDWMAYMHLMQCNLHYTMYSLITYLKITSFYVRCYGFIWFYY